MTGSAMLSNGIVILTVIAVAWGGTFLLRVSTGAHEFNQLQKSYFRAGHAHAGVFLILGFVVRLMVAQPAVPGWAQELTDGILLAAILLPAGFFFSVMGKNPQKPNGFRILIWLGALSLVVGLAAAGIGLIMGGISELG